jgi:mono/diheme cytochrome c family protein
LVLIAREALRPLLLVAGLSATFGVLAQTASTDVPSIRDGVFTAEQASRGKIAYTGPCDRCHGFKLDGASDDPDMLPAPPVAGSKFLRKWNGRTLVSLFDYVRTTMPANNPGYLSEAEVADIVAYMLFMSGMPAGSAALQPDREALARVVVETLSD